jgi:hypothetical protein
MTDIVHYKIPFWFIGDLADIVIARKKLEEIFKQRYKIICETFSAGKKQELQIKFLLITRNNSCITESTV